MKRFYPFWFLFCAVWGYLSAGFPQEILRISASDASGMFLVSTASFYLLVLLLSKLVPASSPRGTRFNIELRPWDDPLGIFQFVFVTFIFVGFWGVALSLVVEHAHRDFALIALAIGAGGLLGGIVATRWRWSKNA